MSKQTAKELARFVRQMCRSLGARMPEHWTDDQVLAFAQSLIEEKSNDRPVLQ